MTDELTPRDFELALVADLELVWEALTSAKGLASWYVVEADLDGDGRVTLDWGTGPYGMGRIEEVERLHRLRVVYAEDATPNGAEEWLLTHREGVTHIRLIHSLPVEPGDTWDGTYPDIVRGWILFLATLRFVAERVGRLGRAAHARVGSYAAGGWPAVLDGLGLDRTPPSGSAVEIGGAGAEVLVSVDGYSLLFAFDDRATLLVDVDGDQLYTLAAGYQDSEQAAELVAALVAVAERACAAAGAGSG